MNGDTIATWTTVDWPWHDGGSLDVQFVRYWAAAELKVL